MQWQQFVAIREKFGNNAREARKSVFVASGIIGFFFLLVCVLGLAAITIVGTDPHFFEGGKVGGTLIGAAIAARH